MAPSHAATDYGPVTVTLTVALTDGVDTLVTVIVAEPSPTAVTSPVVLTVATSSSLDE